MEMMTINKKIAFSFMIMILSIGITAGTVLTADEYLDNLVSNEQTIEIKIQKAIEKKIDEKEANMGLYEAIYFDKELGQTMYFFFRSDDNPFWRANEILEKEEIKFSNLSLRKSKLLEEERPNEN
jgi:hypothetical protein